MDLKFKNGLIKAFCYLLSCTGMAVIVVFQYFANNNPMPTWAKIAVPCLLALLILFLVYYKSIKEKINRKLIAIETAKEMGKAGQTNTIVANILEVLGIVVPLLLIATIFVVGGQYLVRTGTVLFEILGMYMVIVIGNIICDTNTKQELKQKELEEAEKMADSIADKISTKFK